MFVGEKVEVKTLDTQLQATGVCGGEGGGEDIGHTAPGDRCLWRVAWKTSEGDKLRLLEESVAGWRDLQFADTPKTDRHWANNYMYPLLRERWPSF